MEKLKTNNGFSIGIGFTRLEEVWPTVRKGNEWLEKTTFYTKAGDQICAVGYYKE